MFVLRHSRSGCTVSDSKLNLTWGCREKSSKIVIYQEYVTHKYSWNNWKGRGRVRSAYKESILLKKINN